jgi:hypothetical protein
MSGGGKETTTATAAPWESAQPTIKTALSGANAVYKSGDAFKPYTGSTVVPYADQTRLGMQGIQNQSAQAMSDGSMSRPLDFFGSMFQNGGLSQDQRGVADQWRNTASGAELLNTSPEFNDVLQRSLGDARTGVDMSMSGAGRYGSGMHTDVLGNTLGGVASNARLGEYRNQLGRMDTARNSLAGMGQQGITNQFGAASGMPGAWTASQQPATDLMKVGGMDEDLAGRTMADQLRIFEETQNAPREAVEWLSAIGSGAGSLGSTQRQIQPGTNPFVQALGIGLGGNSLLGNPLGSMLGGTVSPSIGMW